MLGSCASRTWSASSTVRKSRSWANAPAASKSRIQIRIGLSPLPLILAHDVGDQLVVNVRQLLDDRFHLGPHLKPDVVTKIIQPPDQRPHPQFGSLIVFALAGRC